MAFLETLKNAGKVVLEAAKANPIAAAAIGAGTVTVVGGGIYLAKRSSKKKAQVKAAPAEAKPADLNDVVSEAAAAGDAQAEQVEAAGAERLKLVGTAAR